KALARVALADGDYPAALARAKTALEGNTLIGMRLAQVELLAIAGEASLAMGNGEATGHFDAMAAIAQALVCPPMLAQARFGQAASRPYERGADLAAEARAIMEAWVDRLTPDGRTAFLAYPERKRVLEGNYIGFSLPLRNRQSGRETGPLGLRPGFRATGEL
ncbi:MAG: hypothetical protein JWM80_912, partial [Cyanobacteria bacterium RYN_339]|nr:hypothetical protein [Cyanobacteria bacterium RYN_339]